MQGTPEKQESGTCPIGRKTYMPYVIVDTCSKDALCVDVCPTDAVHPRKDEPRFEEVGQWTCLRSKRSLFHL